MRRIASHFPPILILILIVLFSYSFTAHFRPSIDLWLSSKFYNEETRNFMFNQNMLLNIMRYLNFFSPVIIMGFCLFVLAVNYFNIKIPVQFKPYLPNKWISLFILLFYSFISIALMRALKLFFQRPRPRDITEFGGDYLFQAAWDKGYHIVSQSWSFPSGESALAMSMIIIPWCMAKSSLRDKLFIIFSIWAVLISFNRILFGAHFLSDVVTSWAIILLLIPICSYIFNYLFIDKLIQKGKNHH